MNSLNNFRFNDDAGQIQNQKIDYSYAHYSFGFENERSI